MPVGYAGLLLARRIVKQSTHPPKTPIVKNNLWQLPFQIQIISCSPSLCNFWSDWVAGECCIPKPPKNRGRTFQRIRLRHFKGQSFWNAPVAFIRQKTYQILQMRPVIKNKNLTSDLRDFENPGGL